MKLFMLGFFIILFGCNLSEQETKVDSNNLAINAAELVKQSQLTEKLGNYQELFVAPFKTGYAVIHASTPKGLDGHSLAFYWVQAKQQQAYTINELAMNLSPELPRFNNLSIKINSGELLAVVKNTYKKSPK